MNDWQSVATLDRGPPLDEVWVWRISLAQSAERLAAWERNLSEAERGKAQRFVQEADRRRAVIGRSVLRQVLAAATGQPAEDLDLAADERGKPVLRGAPPHPGFNVSHSGDWVLVAVAGRGPVGVDVEQHRAVEYDRLVAQCFAPAERAAWQQLEAEDRPRGFFDGWARKEAVVKALGTGLGADLQGFVVPLEAAPNVPAAVKSGTPELADLRLWPLVVDPRHAAAVVAGPAVRRVCCWHLADES